MRAALARGRGVVVWCMRVGSATVIKRGFREQGLPLTHLSRVEHGSTTTTKLGIGVVAPLYRRVEDAALEERVQIPLGESLAYLRTLSERLAANRCVSIFGEHPGRQTVSVEILGIDRRLALGAPSIAWRAGAGLVTAYALRESPFHHRLVVEEELSVDREMPRREFAEQCGATVREPARGVHPSPSRRVARLVLLAVSDGKRARPRASRFLVPRPGGGEAEGGRLSRAGRALARSDRHRPDAQDRPLRGGERRGRPGAAARTAARAARPRPRPAHGAARAAALRTTPGSRWSSPISDPRPARRHDRSGGLAVDARSLPDGERSSRRRCSRSVACCAPAASRSSSSTIRWNPLYHALRFAAPALAPFTLGRTLGRRALCATLERLGFDVIGHDYAIHNPRGCSRWSTCCCARTLGRFAERPIRALVWCFAQLDRLPTRAITACFVAVGARRDADRVGDRRRRGGGSADEGRLAGAGAGAPALVPAPVPLATRGRALPGSGAAALGRARVRPGAVLPAPLRAPRSAARGRARAGGSASPADGRAPRAPGGAARGSAGSGVDLARCHSYETSGSSGEPLRIVRTPHEDARLFGRRLRAQVLAGLRPWDLRVNIGSPRRIFRWHRMGAFRIRTVINRQPHEGIARSHRARCSPTS